MNIFIFYCINDIVLIVSNRSTGNCSTKYCNVIIRIKFITVKIKTYGRNITAFLSYHEKLRQFWRVVRYYTVKLSELRVYKIFVTAWHSLFYKYNKSDEYVSFFT